VGWWLRVVPLAFQAFLMGGIKNPISAVLRSGWGHTDLLPHQPRPALRGLHGARRARPTTSSSTSEAAVDTAADAAQTRASPLASPPIQHVAKCAEPRSGDGIIGSRV
jgi:hypothetical protein